METARSAFLVLVAATLALTACGGGDPGSDDAGRVGPDSGRADGGTATLDAGAPECFGSATPCDILPTTSCATQDGCRLGGECGGFSRSCSSYTSNSTCNGQLGCYWSSSTGSCAGSAWTCSTTSAESNCRAIEGCSWDETCEGFATSCFGLESASTCNTQQGCRWE